MSPLAPPERAADLQPPIALALAIVGAAMGAQIASGQALPAHPNLLENAAFREGVFGPAFWGLNEPHESRAEWQRCRAGGDEFALRLQGCGRDWAGATSTKVSVSPGETLIVAAWVRSDGQAGQQDHLYVRFFAGGRFLGQTGPSVPSGAAEWRLLEGG